MKKNFISESLTAKDDPKEEPAGKSSKDQKRAAFLFNVVIPAARKRKNHSSKSDSGATPRISA